ncbi:PREDICTED: serine carboxypeptidase-like 42 isoform X2 [Lupinus angustifolius]|uniref:serine carboxypeptidase-like 42 isoform X2 n=1 Tax=Lupinus angustifolius TaxID=3871 RepID=UPI00092E82C2|nr:PREDICTED: serine carboxypeptidase-like 42 isoform X2 [Lupinus angustifolius]
MGRCWFFGVLAVVGCACLVGNVVGYPREDLVEKLPGQPHVGFKQYAGYIDIDVKTGKSLFYYFVEAEHRPHKKALTLWLNGGPGCSSIGGGAFSELGPFYPSGDGRGLRINSRSWNKASNLLFVESPAGVGWSYSNTTSDYNAGDASTANDMLVFFLKWYKKFPSYKSRKLFLTGESYAGHYIPQLADAILNYNAKSTGFKFNIKGLAIGNPLLKLGSNDQARYEYYWSHGLISDELGLTIKKECKFDDNVSGGILNISISCVDAMSEASKSVGDYINEYDVILDVCYPAIAEQQLRLHKTITKISVGVDVCISREKDFYLNLPEVQKALHANRTNLPYKWSGCSDVLNYSHTDPSINIVPILKRIVQNHIPVWIFSGDQDAVVPLLGTRTLIRELAQELNFNITVPYGAWFHNGQVGGWAIEYGNILTFATVRGAGHMVPYAQPSRSLHLFSDFVLGRRLPNATRPSIDG